MSGAKHRFSSGIGSKNPLSWKKTRFFLGNASQWELIREEWLAMAYVVFDGLPWLMPFLISDLFGSWTILYHQHGPVSAPNPPEIESSC